jgi:CDP-4-dehydro-6-deoxyglucose reductase
MDFTLTVKKIQENTENTKTLTLVPDKKIDFQPGQFLMYNINGKRVPYSIASSPHEFDIDLCVNKIGPSSSYMHELKIGDTIKADGPYGVFTLKELNNHELVFIATGTGIAPIRSMIHNLIHHRVDNKITLIFGARTVKDLLFKQEWDTFDIKLIPCISREDKKIHVQDAIKDIENRKAHFYICGLPAMVTEVKNILLGKGVLKENIHHEIYT